MEEQTKQMLFQIAVNICQNKKYYEPTVENIEVVYKELIRIFTQF